VAGRVANEFLDRPTGKLNHPLRRTTVPAHHLSAAFQFQPFTKSH